MANETQPTQKVTGRIESVNPLKTGKSTKNGRTFEWTMYEVLIDGQKYITFDSGYQKLIGQTKELEFRIDKRQGRDGQWYENKTLINLPRSKRGEMTPEQEKKIHDKLDKIISLLQTDQPSDYEPGPEEIPPSEEDLGF